ncbi:uncharacterized protein [Rutidosis leptorrhynchoides]|uniref:uncharacterized protein n=1 Tax=Rutidosis leptorrhynchoides TaxID=125765 RepID=UPI003A9955D1
MRLVWSPESASNAYHDTVRACKDIQPWIGAAEYLSAQAAGLNAKLIVETWSDKSPIANSIGLIIGARHAAGSRHVCIVPDERSRSAYLTGIREVSIINSPTVEVIVAGPDPQEAMESLDGVEFMVVNDGSSRFNIRALRFAKFGQNGAVLVCKRTSDAIFPSFNWNGMLRRGTRVVNSSFVPIGKGLDVADIGARYIFGTGIGGDQGANPSHWINYVEETSGRDPLSRF